MFLEDVAFFRHSWLVFERENGDALRVYLSAIRHYRYANNFQEPQSETEPCEVHLRTAIALKMARCEEVEKKKKERTMIGAKGSILHGTCCQSGNLKR